MSIEGSASTRPDTTGPEVSIKIVDGLITGNQVSSHFTVRVICSDSCGINLSEEAGIVLSLAGQNTSETLNATALFEYNQNRYKSGWFESPFIREQPGPCQLICEVSDNLNQVTVDTLEIEIADPNNADSGIPARVTLLNNYPNPFNASTLIHFRLTEPGEVNIRIYNSLGQEIVQITDQYYESGTFTVRWNGRDAANRFESSGAYFCRLIYRSNSLKIHRSQRLLLIR